MGLAIFFLIFLSFLVSLEVLFYFFKRRYCFSVLFTSFQEFNFISTQIFLIFVIKIVFPSICDMIFSVHSTKAEDKFGWRQK